MSAYTVTRSISIDAGHRVMTHGSKCRHLHGHRYTVEATCQADRLQTAGEQSDMVLDFSFLRNEMQAIIDSACDHGFLAYLADDDLLTMFCPAGRDFAAWKAAIGKAIAEQGYCLTDDTRLNTKLYVLDVNPTAEQLSRHWFQRLRPVVTARSGGLAHLRLVTVWETPNCRASYGEP